MRFQSLFFILIIIFSIMFIGCPSGETDDGNNENSNIINTNSRIENKPDRNTNSPAGTEKTPAPQTINKAETIKPVVDAYCDAMRKKDDAALKKVYSQASLKQLQADMREEGFRSLAEYLSNEPVGNTCEVKNEQIAGNAAVALVTTQTYPNGIQLKFVKENGEWKMTNQSSDFDAVRKAARR